MPPSGVRTVRVEGVDLGVEGATTGGPVETDGDDRATDPPACRVVGQEPDDDEDHADDHFSAFPFAAAQWRDSS